MLALTFIYCGRLWYKQYHTLNVWVPGSQIFSLKHGSQRDYSHYAGLYALHLTEFKTCVFCLRCTVIAEHLLNDKATLNQLHGLLAPPETTSKMQVALVWQSIQQG